MKIEIDIKSNIINSTHFSNTELKQPLIIYGCVELIHTANKLIKYPSYQEILTFLNTYFDENNISILQKIEGKYFIIYNLNHKQYLFCYKNSIQRIYYSFHNLILTISDNILSVFSDLQTSQQNAVQFLFFRFIGGRQTLFENIFRLMPCECLVLDFEKNTLKTKQHFIYPKSAIEPNKLSQAGEQMHSLFRDALQTRIEKYPNETLLLPISGGMDSRYILAIALELVDAKRITALTFGSKGSYDYEIGSKVARTAGVRHVAFPLSCDDYGYTDLYNNCLDTDGQINYITELPFKIIKRYEEYGKIVLSGFVGDTIMGAKTKSEHFDNQIDIVLKDSLINDKQLIQKFLSDSTIQSSFYFPSQKDSYLTEFEQWFFLNHFNKYTNYCIFKNQHNLTYISPFIDYQFCDFILKLPFEMRYNRNLYFAEFCRQFPKLASIPLKSYYGKPLNSSRIEQFISKQWNKFNVRILKNNKNVNYIPFVKYTDKILKIKSLQESTKDILPIELHNLIFQNPKYSLLLFNLKCLEILKTNFNVKFTSQ